MSSLITQPENLTKDRLKSELKKRGIAFSPTQPKSYYVELYRERVMSGRGMSTRRLRSEFSSDEELGRVAQQPTPTRAKRYTKVSSPDHYMEDVSKMSDSELARELKQYGINVGPITSSTRSVYQRRLAKLKAERTSGGISQSSSAVTIASESDEEAFSSSDEEEEEEEEEEMVRPVAQSPYGLRSRSQQHKPAPSVRVERKPPSRPAPVVKPKFDPVVDGSSSWSDHWMVWLCWLMAIMLVAFGLGFALFDVYVRGWGDSQLAAWINKYLPGTSGGGETTAVPDAPPVVTPGPQ